MALARAGVADREGNEQPLVTTLRQHQHIVEARDAFAAARKAKHHHQEIEIIALELRAATQALARFRGIEVGERVLDELFSRFCIGK
jgi:tRNA modification GTPase